MDADGNALCTSDMVKVTAVVDRKTTPVGIGVHIKMSVKNTSSADCIRDVGSGANEIVIAGQKRAKENVDALEAEWSRFEKRAQAANVPAAWIR